MNEEFAVTLSRVTLQYPGSKGETNPVLDGIDLSVRKGEFISLLGPSGCGKTTLLKLIADLLQPTAGEISVVGMTPAEARRQHKYGMVFQSPALLEWRTVEQNISLPMEVLHLPKAERARRIHRQLEMIDMVGHEQNYPRELSGGMQQRVGIARALSTDPELLLMDEPFSALDEFTKERLHGDLLRIWQNTGKTVIFVTHSIEEAVYLSDRICILSANPARLVSVVEVDLPRPREPVLRKMPEFYRAVAQVRSLFEVNYNENI